MLTAPTNWNTLWAQLGTDMEVRLSIGGKNYLNADIAAGSLKLTHALYDSYSTGNANAAKLSCTLFTTDTMPEGAAKAVLSVRLTNGATTTSWVSQGTYYLDTAELTESDTTKIVLYDGLALADRYLYTDGVVPESETYPQNALTMVNAICSLLGLSLDTSNKTAWQAVECSAPDGMSCRQILQSIAAAAGGNWTMSKAGKLLFVPLCDVSTQLKSGLEASASSFSVTSTKKRVMVASLHNGQETFTRGTGGYEVAATCAFASDANMTRAFNALQGKQYQGFKAQGVFISPLVELGDIVSVTGGQDMVADSYTLTYQQGCWGDMDSPLGDEVEKRIGAIDSQARQMRIAKYAALIDELDQTITSGEIFNSIIEQLNAKANETGGWFYYVEGKGVRTYDKAVSDPAVGAEATQCVEIRGGVIRIANSKDKNGNWIFRSVFESGHIASELVTAVQITSGYIGSKASGNYINLDTGEATLLLDTKVGKDGTTLADIAKNSENAANAVGDVSLLKAGSAKSVDVQYGISSSASAQPTSWQTTARGLWNQKGKFLWSRQKITMYNGKITYSTPRLLSDGKQLVKSMDEQYYLSTSKSAPAGGSWSSTQQSYVNGRYYFTRTKIEWVDGTITYEPSVNGELVQAFTSVRDVYDSRLDQLKVFNILTKNGTAQGFKTDEKGNLYFNASYIATGILSDKRGLNYWNLNTGDVRMVGLAAVEEKVDNLKVGGTNLLNGTAAWTGWTKRRVSVSGEQANFPAQSKDWDSSIYSPLAAIQYGKVKGKEVTVSFDVKCSSSWGTVADKNAVWACLELHTTSTRSRHKWRTFRIAKQPTTTWQRVSFTTNVVGALFTGGTGSISDANLLGLEIYNRSNKALQIRRVKMEIGNVATDWCATDYDAQLDAQTKANNAANNALTQANKNATDKANKALSDAKADAASKIAQAKKDAYAYSKTYADGISKSAKEYTDKQKKDLRNSLNQAAIFNELTDNGKVKTFRFEKGELYINATYIKSGTLDASVLKAGVIAPSGTSSGNFQINMATGYAMFKNVNLQNMTATGGRITSDAGSTKLQIEGGQIRGYRGTKRVGFIDATARTNILGSKTNKVLKTVDGLQIQSEGILRISSPRLGVANTADTTKVTTSGFTGTVKLKNMTFGMNNKMTSCKSADVEFKFINGIFVGLTSWNSGMVSKTTQEGEGK